MTLDIPRDRAGTFDPQLIAKYQRRFPDFDEKIISMYARGMTVREIRGHLQELYGIEVSPDLISTVTDAVLEAVGEWQNRPLDACYAIVFFDAIRVKIRDEGFVRITEASIIEHVDKARHKIESGDHAGAIANSYTLVEGFLKELLRRTGTSFNESEGDIRSLYKLVAAPLNLEPKGDHLERHLKAILEGLQRQIGGLFEVANKASDRHARQYNPAPHHAKLAVNATFTLCEFLLESYVYQQKRDDTRRSS